MERTISPVRRLSTILLAFALLLGLSAVGSVALASNTAQGIVRINKVDEANAPLAGARLQIQNANGSVVQEFVSDGGVKEFSLDPGTYKLVEVAAPEGYDAANPINFTIERPTVQQQTQVVAPATSAMPTTQVVALGSGGDDRGRNGGYTVEATTSPDYNYTRDYKYGEKYPLFCLDATKPNGEWGALSYELGDVNGLTRNQLLRIMYVGSLGDAKGYGARLETYQGLGGDRASQFWLATAYAINYYTNGQAVAWDHRGQYLTSGNLQIANQMIQDALDESITIPEGTVARLYQRPAENGQSYQPVATAAFPQVQVDEIVSAIPVDITMVNQKSATKKGKVVIKKVDTAGNFVAGAQLQIRDANGNIVADFTATDAPMEFDLAPGDYVLHESWAPAGYKYSDDIPFSVKETKTETVSTFPSGSVTVRGDGWDYRRTGLQFLVTDNGDYPAYCIEVATDDPPVGGAPYREIDTATYSNQYAMYQGDALIQAMRRVVYAGYGSDAFGKVAASGLNDSLAQDATRFAVSAIVNYSFSYQGSKIGETLMKGNYTPSGGYPEINLVKQLIAIGQDSSIQVPADFKVKIFVPVQTKTQPVIVGYWDTTTTSSTIEPAEVTMVDAKEEPGKVIIKKTDTAGNLLKGAKLQILSGGGRQLVHEFVFNGEPVQFQLASGSYILHEVEAPAGYQLATDVEFVIPGSGTLDAAETIEVTMVDTKNVTIGTSAADTETRDNIAYADGKVTIVDTVTYEGAVAGQKYTMKGQLVKKSDRSVLATGEQSFTAPAENGNVQISFTIDASALAGDSAVAFEEMYDAAGALVASHQNINDAGQTVVFPSAKTNATDKSDGDHAAFGEKITIVDEVTYTNLIPGKEYTVSGTLHDKATGEALTVSGATASKTFTAENANGSVKLEFTIDAKSLVGKALVAFEEVAYQGKTVAVHADINDENQTVVVEERPSIGTTATDGATNDHIGQATANTVLKDVVTYKGLKPGQTYTVKGQLMKRADSSAVAGAVAEKTFTASESGAGTVELVFTYDATKLAGFASVAFEELYDAAGALVAEHKDIKDGGQTVVYPEIRTNATDPADGDQVIKPSKQTTVVDTVSYKNLVPGKEYTVSGTLMKKSDGQPLVIDGKAVTASRTFTPEKERGSIELEFTFDASSLASTTLVAFEKVTYNDDVVATHEDLTDADQTVVVSKKPQIRTTATDKADGDKVVEAAAGQVVVDTVICTNLEKGKTYTMRGTLMDKATNAPVMVGNDKVVVEKEFKAEAENGTVTLEFTVNATDLAGKQLVVFEKLLDANGEQVAKHENINDEGQTVVVRKDETRPEIGTTATDATTGDHIGLAAKDATIVDVVAYKGLTPGKEYTVKGQLMKKADGSKIPGATAEKTFTASETGEGTVELAFTFDATAMARFKAVAFEQVFDGGELVASHEDINDADQSVTFPELRTNATDQADGDQNAPAGTITIVDKVTYTNLLPGKTYTVSGTLMKKSDGKPLEAEGATASKTFEAKTANGSVNLEFTIDASALAGEKIVAFEKVSVGEDVVAVHEDLTDKDQTVTIEEKPEIATTASAEDGAKTVALGEKVEVVDVVKYENLKPGTEYTLSGKLVTKASNGKQVVAEATALFTPEQKNGETTLVFTVDTTNLAGEELVAFERVTFQAELVASHEDINDKAQTVNVEEQPEIEKYVNKNVHTSIDLDEVFTYDVLAYITKDADKAEITDTLNADLQFVSAASDVKVVDLGLDVDHRPNGSVAHAGTAVAAAKAAIKGQTLTVTLDPAKALRGHWVKVTFDAKIADGKKVADLKYATISENDPVLTDEKHEGVPNTASYTITVGNEGTYSDESNTVTVNPKEPGIGTTATDKADGDKELAAAKNALVKDVVEYKNLKANTKYTLKGTLMNKATGKAVATGEAEFTSTKSGKGTAEMVFTIDTTKLEGASLVAYEYVWEGALAENSEAKPGDDTELVKHEDINDKEQTVTVEEKPEIETNATDKADGDQTVKPATVTIVDKVTYTNLVVGKEYTVSGTLMKKSDGKPLEAEGATATKTFTAETKNGSVDLEFTIDASALAGEKIVAFEKLSQGEEVVATHEDLTDADQTVTVSEKPEIATTATAGNTNAKVVATDEKAVVVDTVAYSNLEAGKTYTLKGQLVTKDSKGKTVVAKAEKAVKAEAANGTWKLEFTFDASKLEGATLVVFEKLFEAGAEGEAAGTEVATHEDLNDKEQTVTVKKDPKPEIATNATDKADGNHAVTAGKVTIVDEVTYTNLKPGKEYTVSGTLMKKSDGTALKVAGATATKTFKPETANGSVKLEFTIDASALAGEKIVAFEKLSQGEDVVATHEDITDADQTVVVEKKREIATNATDAKDADKVIASDGTATVNDAVDYDGFEVGKEYTLKGMLVKKSDGSVVATGEKTFTAAAAKGTETIVFTFDAAALEGEELVAYEYAFEGKAEGVKAETAEDVKNVEETEGFVAKHEDIDDAAQTVVVSKKPVIYTTATDAEGNKVIDSAAGKVQIVDTVKYYNLEPGKTYTMEGKLVDKAAGAKAAMKSDGVAQAKVEFTASATGNGKVKIVFTVDAAKNAGMALVAFEKLYDAEGEIVATHEDITDKDQTVTVTEKPEPSIATTASDNADGDTTLAPGKAVVKDVVVYENLEAGKKYTMDAQLVTKADGGKTVVATATAEFEAAKSGKGSVDVFFEIDAAKYAGQALVAFEKAIDVETQAVVATHEDLNDEDQTVTVRKEDAEPVIATNATDAKDADKVIASDGTATVNDAVDYKGFEVGKEYTLKGMLVKKSDGSVVATGEKTFTAQAAEGTETIVFTFDAAALAGEELVAYEYAFEGAADVTVTTADEAKAGEQRDDFVAKHEDINDEAQTVVVEEKKPEPKLATVATDAATKEHVSFAGSGRTIVDVVTYKSLEAGKKYTLKGTLVKKSDASAIATGEATFVADESGEGTAQMLFENVDLTALAGDAAVAYEYLFSGDVTGKDVTEESEEFVAKHEDINDESQTVYVPEARTNASDQADGDHTVKPADKVTIVDTVTYTNLVPGKEYTVSGTLMKKSDGKALEAEGATATKTFTAKNAHGSVELEFTIDASALAGEQIVAFEKVAYGEEVVAVHEDLSDADQTVVVEKTPYIGTTAAFRGSENPKAVDLRVAPDTIRVVDTVSYTDVAPGDYTLSGKLVKKADAVEAQTVLAEVEAKVTADKSGTGIWEVTFEVPKADIAAVVDQNVGEASLVAFEKLMDGDRVVAVHEDITDADQTVYVTGRIAKGEFAFPVVKVDEEGNLVAGATLEVRDEQGAVIQVRGEGDSMQDSWVTSDADDAIKVIEVPAAGTYTVFETKAPEGYEIAEAIKVEVFEGGFSTDAGATYNGAPAVVMVDKKTPGNSETPTPSNPTPNDSETPTPSNPTAPDGSDPDSTNPTPSAGQQFVPGSTTVRPVGNSSIVRTTTVIPKVSTTPVRASTRLPVTGLSKTGASTGVAMGMGATLAGLGFTLVRRREAGKR